MAVALALRHVAGVQEAGRLVGEDGHTHVEQSHVDVLAHSRLVAHVESGEDGGGRVHTREQVGQRHTHPQRAAAGFAVGPAGDAHHAAHGLDHQVVPGAFGIRPVLAEAGDRAVNEAWVQRPQAGVVQPVLLQAADLEVLDQDVGLGRHLADQLLAFGRGHVDGDRTFVAVASGEVAGLGCVLAVGVLQEGRAPVARVIPRAGAFHLDHIRAQVGQDLGAPRAGQHTGQVEHFDSVEGGGRGGGLGHGF